MEEEPVAWKSHMGIHLSSSGRTLRSSAKGWGRTGAMSDALLTRGGSVEGFLATITQPNTPLFIGFSALSGTLNSAGRAHQDDLEFSLRLAADGTFSYQSRAKLLQVREADPETPSPRARRCSSPAPPQLPASPVLPCAQHGG